MKTTHLHQQDSGSDTDPGANILSAIFLIVVVGLVLLFIFLYIVPRFTGDTVGADDTNISIPSSTN